MSTNATPQTDPNVKIPAHVLAQAARADEFYKAPEEAPKQEEAAPETDAVVTKEVKAETAPVQKPTETNVDWKHRYESENGRVRTLNEKLREAAETVSQLRRQNADLVAQLNAPRTVEQNFKFVTDEEEAEYGKDLITLIDKKAAERAEPLRRQLEEVQKKLASVDTDRVMTKQERFYQQLDNRVSNWREINTNPEFLNWLAQVDPYSGQPRADMIKYSHSQMDAARTAAFFEGFLRETNATVAPQPTSQPVADKPSLEQFAAPGRAKSAAPQSPADKPIFTRADIAKFYTDVHSGKYRSNPKERESFEKKIFEAQAEGRIR